MYWKIIIKDKKNQPSTGEYSDWKQQIAKECFYQCVYCSIHESQFGGTINYHIDHFRPISKFKLLINDICNLFYACPICNRFKSNDWPGEPDINSISYPDPCVTDYNTLFKLDTAYNLVGIYSSSKYLTERLFLNRAQLIYERRESALRERTSTLISQMKGLIDQLGREDLLDAFDTLRHIDTIKNNLLGLEEHRRKMRPYEVKDVKK